ncbi:hypothetical protein FHE74_09490 [Corynebacterium tapiri]|uniref:Terminal beta-(1->2)-arabinofuranosyltransferase C-terminal domain-containing protein n=1 Tax=Corynebacterium tapiri TaxID=1448266 RepID=A0A5C4U1H3_9CORY|nr:hypothetical protein FHE74_09490 [Corynebacterium tapiri]
MGRVSLAVSTCAVVLIAAIGGWMRRWMSDDGLIVLRTVRNLAAGNGPVFNAGERVETNTSTLWQYLILVGSWFTDARLEIIALYLALALTILGALIACFAAYGLYPRARSTMFLPAGALIYFALPPARDFATSGLEWGLCLFWLAVLFGLLVLWARGGSEKWTYLLAFWAGLSWLVRPELVLYGALSGLLVVITARSWGKRAALIGVGALVPGAYQIFRMGYYGLLTPHTAVAKSASGARWGTGWEYVLDLTQPYQLWIALAFALVIATGIVLREDIRWTGLRSAPVAAGLVIVAGLLHLLYVVRVGGDFMHGRMALLPLFAVLLPLWVVPGVEKHKDKNPAGLLTSGAVAALAVWAGVTMHGGTEHTSADGFEVAELGVVDEREFWTWATERAPGDAPLVASDFTPYDLAGHWTEGVDLMMRNDAAWMFQYIDPKKELAWAPVDRMPGENDHAPTAYFINLGLTGMNAPLDVRVLDTVGLSTPLAARQPRLEHGRIGHDKELPMHWQAADTDAALDELPPWVDAEQVERDRLALKTPEVQALVDSYRAPLTWDRFVENIRFALGDGRTLEIPATP